MIGKFGISSDEYHADPSPAPSLSRGVIRDLLYKSPAHAYYNHPRFNPGKEQVCKDIFDRGTVAHALLLEGMDNVVIIDAEDWRKKETKEIRDKAREDGKIALLRGQYETVKGMVTAAKEQISDCPELGLDSLQITGDSELSYFWKETDHAGRITQLKCRPDWISNNRKLIIDYKTTDTSANPDDYSRLIISSGLDIQEALYRRAVKAVEGVDAQFVFVVQETCEPYLCSFIALPPEFQEMGKQKVGYGIYLWNKCMESGIWPGYPNRIAYPDVPAWALASWENKAAMIS